MSGAQVGALELPLAVPMGNGTQRKEHAQTHSWYNYGIRYDWLLGVARGRISRDSMEFAVISI